MHGSPGKTAWAEVRGESKPLHQREAAVKRRPRNSAAVCSASRSMTTFSVVGEDGYAEDAEIE
jgi:hypothetical protein